MLEIMSLIFCTFIGFNVNA